MKILKTVVPLIVLGLYIGVILYLREKIPNPEALLKLLENLYKTHGYSLVFFGAILEATFPIGFYFPGSQVMLLGAALSKTGVLFFPFTYGISLLGLCIGFIINYLSGKYGWYHVLSHLGFEKGISTAKQKLHKHGAKAILLGYFYPGTATLLSTAAGIVKIPFKRFLVLSIISQAFWGLFWGGLAYIFGMPLINFLIQNLIYVVIAVGIWWVVQYVRNRNKVLKSE